MSDNVDNNTEKSENTEKKNENDSKKINSPCQWPFTVILVSLVAFCAIFFVLIFSIPKLIVNADDLSVSITFIICITLLAVAIIIVCAILAISFAKYIAESAKENPSKSYYDTLNNMLSNNKTESDKKN